MSEHHHITPRSEHNISRADISPNALKVLNHLKRAGYAGYLVGGGVRDLLLGREPKDFDIATEAHPEQVRKLFKNCRLIGRRFRLAHIHFRGEIIEVATFRASHDAESDQNNAQLTDDGRILRDNVYGSLEEDAWRRDFSVNALYYNIADFSLVDYTGGLPDLQQGILRVIGDPAQRYREDPVRMLRAVRFAVRLGFRIHPESESPLFELAPILADVPPARTFDEVLKLFHSGMALQTFEQLRHYNLFAPLFPATEESLAIEEEGFPIVFVAKAMANTDLRINAGKPVTPAFLFAALLWEPVRQLAAKLEAEGASPVGALQQAGHEITAAQMAHVTIPKRFSIPMREIWTMQPRLEIRRGKRPLRLLGHPRFRAAYDFLLLRAEVGEVDSELAEWWTEFQTLNEGEQQARVGPNRGSGSGRRRRPRRSGGSKAGPAE